MSRTRIPLSRQDENARLMKERLEMSTAEIGLSVRTTNCLEERGIFTVRDLLNSTPDQLLSIANFGENLQVVADKSVGHEADHADAPAFGRRIERGADGLHHFGAATA